jgi:hypothetical protein
MIMDSFGRYSVETIHDHAAERRQELRYRKARDQPGRDDDPAKFDGERADSPEYGVDAHRQLRNKPFPRSRPDLSPCPAAGGDLVIQWDADNLLKRPSVNVQVTKT